MSFKPDMHKDMHLLSSGFTSPDNHNPGQFGMPQAIGTQWLGYTKCDFCDEECTTHLYDVKTLSGTWGVLCDDCWPIHGNPGHMLGVGFGQKYERREHGNYYKIKG